ncbi:hypothetical protein MSIMFB_05706 [Mycobacterium simulans]|uniref:Uncharacterized protein n=1 Tax=Mycobacterium simulans TaxID=627089 RepID=A0A7Z7IQZ6_9MYCO|nr:hypothetical protein MSIMFB_05706 [Mycobacterium simulans]
MATDPSSAPAANTPVVWAAAAVLAALSAEPIPSKSVAAATNNSGATTNDIAHLPAHANRYRGRPRS